MKYVGSKSAIARYIVPFIQDALVGAKWYVEPFVGGANMMSNIKHPYRIGADSNRFVIALLGALRDGWVPPHIDRDAYNDIRVNNDGYDPALVGWAGIGCSYSGKWFGGYAGVVQTRAGERDYIAEARRNCIRQAPSLRGAVFNHAEFTDMQVPPGSVIYCDPPYANTLKYPGEFDTGKFWLWCQEVSRFNTVLVSEYSAPEGWTPIWSKEVGSSLSANGSAGGRKKSIEMLFTYTGLHD